MKNYINTLVVLILGAAITSVENNATNPLMQVLGTVISKVSVQFAPVNNNNQEERMVV